MPEFFGRPRQSRLGEILAQMEQQKYQSIAGGIGQAAGAIGGALGTIGQRKMAQEQAQSGLMSTLAQRGLIGQGGLTGTVVNGQKVWDQGTPLAEAFPSAGFKPGTGMFLKTQPTEESMSPLEVIKTGRFQPKIEIPDGTRITSSNFSKYFELVPQTFVDEKGRTVTTAPKGAKILSGKDSQKAPPGFRYTDEGDLEPIPGGPAATKAEDAAQKKRDAMASVVQSSTDAVDAARKALELVGPLTSGLAAPMAKIGGTDARALSGYIDTLKSKLAFGQLQQMREQSKTGGAVGQVSDNELRLLSSAVASLDMGQPPKVLRENITKVLNQYQAVIAKMQSDTADSSGAGWTPDKEKRLATLKAKMAKKG